MYKIDLYRSICLGIYVLLYYSYKMLQQFCTVNKSFYLQPTVT